jgi:hypothetical protein
MLDVNVVIDTNNRLAYVYGKDMDKFEFKVRDDQLCVSPAKVDGISFSKATDAQNVISLPEMTVRHTFAFPLCCLRHDDLDDGKLEIAGRDLHARLFKWTKPDRPDIRMARTFYRSGKRITEYMMGDGSVHTLIMDVDENGKPNVDSKIAYDGHYQHEFD